MLGRIDKKKAEIRLSDHFTGERLLRFVMPSVIMMVFTSIYGVVDGLFVSNYVGKTPFAALNLIYPLLMILGGLGFMVGTGGSAVVAMALGEGKKEKGLSDIFLTGWSRMINGGKTTGRKQRARCRRRP